MFSVLYEMGTRRRPDLQGDAQGILTGLKALLERYQGSVEGLSFLDMPLEDQRAGENHSYRKTQVSAKPDS